MQRFVALREKMYEVVRIVLRRCLKPTKDMIANLIACEMAYINTNHPDFIGGSRAISAIAATAGSSRGGGHPSHSPSEATRPSGAPVARPVPTNTGMTSYDGAQTGSAQGGIFSSFLRGGGGPGSATPGKRQLPGSGSASESPMITSAASLMLASTSFTSTVQLSGLKLSQVPEIVCAPEEPTDRERIETDIIKSLILSYFNIVKRNICDMVPKAIMNFTVNTAKEVLQKELVTQLYKHDLFMKLLKEPEDIAERRNRCKEMLEVLRAANEIIAQIRDFNPRRNESSSKTSVGPQYTSITGLKPNVGGMDHVIPFADHQQRTWEGM